MKAETITLYWNRPDFALDDHVWKQHVVVLSLLLAAYECGNMSAAAVYGVSLTTVDIKSLLPCITLVAPIDYLLCVSVSLSLCLSVCFCVLAITTQCSNAKSQPQ